MDEFTEYYQSQLHPVRVYLAQMNKLSKKIGMQNSNFVNPHGLSNPDNYSCAEDLCRLCGYCMENWQFRAVVGVRSYEGKFRVEEEEGKMGERDME